MKTQLQLAARLISSAGLASAAIVGLLSLMAITTDIGTGEVIAIYWPVAISLFLCAVAWSLSRPQPGNAALLAVLGAGLIVWFVYDAVSA